MGCGDGPAEVGGDLEPDAGAEEGAAHAEDECERPVLICFGVDDAALQGFRDAGSEEISSAKLHDGGEKNGSAEGERSRSDGGAHRIGDIVGADVPRHVEADDEGQDC